VKFYPEIVLAAMNKNNGVGGVRLFCIAKHYDNGSGFIPNDEFKAYAKRYLGIPAARFNRWLRDAQRIGIIKRSGNVLTLRSWGKAAVAVGVEGFANPVEMGVTKISSEGWAAWVWAAYLKRHEGKPIARSTMERLTGVPERTQRHYEAEAGVKNQANYAMEAEPIAKEEDGYFWHYGQPRKRLGNSRVISGVERCKRGRTKKHNSEIWAASSLWGGSQPNRQRLYFDGPNRMQALKKALRAMRKSNQPANQRPNELFIHSGNALGVALWAVYQCN